MYRRMTPWVFAALLAGLMVPVVAGANSLLQNFEKRVTEFTLDNGLHFIIIERHQAPVVSFHTHVTAGAVDEETGATGLAHMFEHMAFKGTTTIGTSDIEAERDAMARVDEIFLELKRERAKGRQVDEDKVAKLEKDFEAAIENSKEYVVEGEFEEILERAGAQGLNAFTASDMTGYLYSLPANKLELFFAMEADRFLNPVLREFYVERDVVMEERRMRVESNPIGRLVEETLGISFLAHPYGQPGIGHMSDLKNLSRPMAREFFERYYRASNMTIAIAGDVDPAEAKRLAGKYFSGMPAGEPPLPVITEEPPQRGERRVEIVEQTQPWVVVAYHRPNGFHEDDPVYRVMSDILSTGRTSRFHKQLVETELALQTQTVAAFPGQLYPTLFAGLGIPSQGVSPDKLESEMLQILDNLKNEPVSQEALDRAKIRARSQLVSQLDSNSGLARQMASAHGLAGDWREVFRELDRIQQVTAEDVQRVARDTFTDANRNVAVIRNADSEAQAQNNEGSE